MTNQEAFDIVVKHLLRQQKRSLRIRYYGPGGSRKYSCAYRGIKGRMCAFGPFIPDEVYNKKGLDIEHYSIREILDDFDTQMHHVWGVEPRLFEELQTIHDHSTPKLWPKKLQELADAWGLTFPNMEAV